MAPHQECECGILNAGILTEEHGWSDNLSREKELHTRGQLRRELPCTISILRCWVLGGCW